MIHSSSYRRTGHRVSLLPIAQFCQKAPALSEEHGAGRAAAMSSAFHAREGKQPNAEALWSLLTDEEQVNVSGWKIPTDVEVSGAGTLAYALAEKEVALGLDSLGYYVDPSTGEECLTIGHMDFGWVADVEGQRIAYVADIKKTIWAATEGPESLQLHAYGMAYGMKVGADGYVTGIWVAEDGEWVWSSRIVMFGSDEHTKLWDRVRFAAGNKGSEASTGAHCRSCYGRRYCDEHVLPAAAAHTWLAPVAKGEKPTSESAYRFVMALQAAQEILKAAKENMEQWVLSGEIEVRDPSTGKIWAPVKMPGREGVDKVALAEKLGDLSPYIKRGLPYDQFRWKKG